MNRTHYNGILNIENLNQVVELKGWVAKKRDLGGLVFIDLRDKTGITQIVVKPENINYNKAVDVKSEYVIYVKGTVIKRESINKNIPTGEIEVDAIDFEVINTAKLPPIIVADKTDALEETRLKYRYLDLRRPVMQNYITQKSRITSAIRSYLSNLDFLELETPILAKSTPEGARDYLVPSRLYPGEFYALPQSPQIFKQLYMVSGFEKYFQIARCFRDEDLRLDRQPEFTQIDIEASFVTQEEIWTYVEGMFTFLFRKILNIDLTLPFTRLTYDYVMQTYGSDKPDLRFDMKLIDVKHLISNVPFMVENTSTKAIVANKAFTRKELDEYTRIAKNYKATGLAFLKYQNNELTGSIAKFLTEEDKVNFINELNLQENDTVLLVTGTQALVNRTLGGLRCIVAKDLDIIDNSKFEFVWVTDFPIFEYDEETNEYTVSTHPFTAPKPECIEFLETDKSKCYANAYDLVLNGYELASGSLRVYNEELQNRMFKAIGLSDEEITNRFGFFVDALKYGTPPHGGIGIGLERVVMLMLGTENIKDVVAFPKVLSARDLMMECPSTVDDIQLKDVHIKIDE
ncbi:MAG: aspartate--tRNA ligase [bacterium]